MPEPLVGVLGVRAMAAAFSSLGLDAQQVQREADLADGDLADPDSPIQAVVREPDVSLLRPDLGTGPRVYYVGLESEVR